LDEPEAEAGGRARRAGADLDLNDLDVFCRVVERSGFSRAARDLGVPASTVSRRIARLEDALGTRLLQRTTRKLHLTDAGRVYFDQVSRALREIESAEVFLQAAQGTPRGRVRLTTVNEPFIEELLFDFMDRYPDITLEIDKSHRRVDLVAEGFDLAIRGGMLADSSLVAHKLLTSGPVIVAAPSYLAARGTPTTLSDLRDHDCVILGTSATGASWMLRGPKGESRVAVSGRLAINDFHAAVAACLRGLGLGLFPEHFIQPLLASGELVPLLREASPAPTGLWIVYPSRTLVAPAVRAVIDYLKERCETAAPSALAAKGSKQKRR
jgi:DNA-binding transcriptional LysR family regulator